MSLSNILSPRMMVGAAIVGIVGAAGVFIYEKVYAEQRRAMLVNEVARLDRQMASMRIELEAVRELQKEAYVCSRQARRPRPRPRAKREVAPAGDATDSEYYTDCQSLAGTDIEMDSEEFYDVPSDEDDTLRESIGKGQAMDEVPSSPKPDEHNTSNGST